MATQQSYKLTNDKEILTILKDMTYEELYDKEKVGELRKKVETVVINSRVTIIPGYLFSLFRNLTKVVFETRSNKANSGSVSNLGTLAHQVVRQSTTKKHMNKIGTMLRYKYRLTDLKEIGINAFYGCTQLESITIPKSVEILEDKCFSECKNLKSIIFEENSKLKFIGQECFRNCQLLKSITIPNNIVSLGFACFTKCDNLTVIVQNSEKLKYANNFNMNNNSVDYREFSNILDIKNTLFSPKRFKNNNNSNTTPTIKFLNRQKAATQIQARFRGQRTRKNLQKQRNAAIAIQSKFRNYKKRTKKNKSKSRSKSKSKSRSKSRYSSNSNNSSSSNYSSGDNANNMIDSYLFLPQGKNKKK